MKHIISKSRIDTNTTFLIVRMRLDSLNKQMEKMVHNIKAFNHYVKEEQIDALHSRGRKPDQDALFFNIVKGYFATNDKELP